jgi:hypothetical protein
MVSEGTAWFVVPLPLAGLVAGILAGIVGHLFGYGFSVPALVCVALGAAFPYFLVLQQIRGADRSGFLIVSAILAGLIILLIALGHLALALISAVLASAWPAYFFFKTWDPKADLERMREPLERYLRDEANRDR